MILLGLGTLILVLSPCWQTSAHLILLRGLIFTCFRTSITSLTISITAFLSLSRHAKSLVYMIRALRAWLACSKRALIMTSCPLTTGQCLQRKAGSRDRWIGYHLRLLLLPSSS